MEDHSLLWEICKWLLSLGALLMPVLVYFTKGIKDALDEIKNKWDSRPLATPHH